MQHGAMNNTELLKGTLGTIILKLLEERGRMYGYEIVQLVKEMSGEKILVKEGSLYPALHKLEADKLLVAEEVFIGKRVRKYYSLHRNRKNVGPSICRRIAGVFKNHPQPYHGPTVKNIWSSLMTAK